MEPRIEIRKMTPGDIDAVRALDQTAHGQPWPKRTLGDQIAHANSISLLAVDTTDPASPGQHVGHALATGRGPHFHITNVAVAAEWQGQGIATRLIEELMVRRPGGCDHVRLQVRASNRGAQRFYTRLGFAPVGITRDFYDRDLGHGTRDAIEMTRTLTPAGAPS